jgi:hypothetical protein
MYFAVSHSACKHTVGPHAVLTTTHRSRQTTVNNRSTTMYNKVLVLLQELPYKLVLQGTNPNSYPSPTRGCPSIIATEITRYTWGCD